VIVVVAVLPFETVTGLGWAVRLKSPSAFTVSAIVVVAVRPSSVPVTVTLNVPTVAVALTLKVTSVLFTAGFGLNDAVTPLGRPEIENVTGLLSGLASTVVAPVLPCVIVSELGVAISPRPGATVSFTVVVCDRLPDVPVMVIVLVPVAAVAPTVSVNLLVEVAGFVPNEAVTPFGNPEAASVTSPVKPFSGVIVMVEVPEAS
jgi:hypothetical protein